MTQTTPFLYYIRNKHAGFLGNAPTWYAKDGNGYTAYILGAERFSEADAMDMVNKDPEKWEAYRCDHVDERLHLVFDDQDKKRLGTDAPCGWQSGYAINPHVNINDDLVAALNASNEYLKNLYDYAVKMRRKVISNMDAAQAGDFTFIDLDTLDEIMCQGKENEKILSKARGDA